MPVGTNTILSKYSIGDMIVIPGVNKVGVIISLNKYHRTYQYTIFWQYKDGERETVYNTPQGTIDMWLSKKEGKGKDNPNYHIPVPK
jgi:hypothetical protein